MFVGGRVCPPEKMKLPHHTTCSCTARAALGRLAGGFQFLQMNANSMGVKSMQRMHVRGRLDSKVN
jgi:hypothetical protein